MGVMAVIQGLREVEPLFVQALIEEWAAELQRMFGRGKED